MLWPSANRDSVVDIVTRVWGGERHRNRTSIPGRGNMCIFFTASRWASCTVGIYRYFPGDIAARALSWQLNDIVPRFMMSGGSPPLARAPTWLAEGQLHFALRPYPRTLDFVFWHSTRMTYYWVTGTVFVLWKAFHARSTVKCGAQWFCRGLTSRRAGSVQGQSVRVLAY